MWKYIKIITMLFPNEYYGYHSRKKRYDKSKKKSQKG